MNAIRPDSATAEGVFVSVTIAAEPSTVWKFLSDGPLFAAWIGAFAGQGPQDGTRIDPRIGGEVRVTYPGGHVALGKVTAMETARRIAFSWGYEKQTHGLAVGESSVEITLTPVAGGTLVHLVHTGLPTDEARRGHLGGWKHYLSMLAREAAAMQHHEAAQRAFDAYFRAWAEPDAAARMKLLEASCALDARVRTSFACTDGLLALSDHIGNGQRHMPGIVLRGDGLPQTCHEFVRAPWSLVGPDGKVLMRGVNFARLTLSGKLESVVSFQDAPEA